MLNPDADCPAADHEQTKIMNSDYVRKLNEANQV